METGVIPMRGLVKANPLITLPLGMSLLAGSSLYIDRLYIPLLFFLQLVSFVFIWLGLAQVFERHPFPLNGTKEQHMDWMALVQYVSICVICAVMLWFDPQRFDWLANGSRFYFTLTVANIAYYVVHMIAAPYYLHEPLVWDKIVHHIGFMVLFATALLLGHWEYIFIWIGFLSLLYAIPFKISLLYKASHHPKTFFWYLIQYWAWVVLRVGVFGALMVYYFFILDKSNLPTSVFWSLFVPLTFLMQAGLTAFWTVDMTRMALKVMRRRGSKRLRVADVRI